MTGRTAKWVVGVGLILTLVAAAALVMRTTPLPTERAHAQEELEEAYALIDTWDGAHGQGAPGSLLYPSGVEVADSSLYVVDTGNHRIQEFSPTGAFVRAWGQLGSDLGDLRNPQDVAVDGDRIYATDRGNARIAVFDRQGNALESWFAPDMDSPWGITAGGGRVYVTLPDNGQVVVFEGGNVVDRWQNLQTPRGIELGADGRIYVAEEAASAVGFYSSDGTKADSLSSKLAPLDVALDEHSDLYVQSRTAVLWFEAGSEYSSLAMYYEPFRGVTVTSRYGVFATVASDALQVHSVFKYPYRPPEPKRPVELSALDYPPGRLNAPHGVAVGPGDEIWLLDSWPRVQAFDTDGRPLRQFRLPAQHAHESAASRAIDLLARASGAVIAGESERLVRIGPDGMLWDSLAFSSGGPERDREFWLTALAQPSQTEYAMALDSANMQVGLLGVTMTLRLDSVWPLDGVDSPAKWELYWDLATARGAGQGGTDRVYAVNRTDRRIEVYDGASLVESWQVEGIPIRAALDTDGSLFVLTAAGLVWKYDSDGQVLAGWDAGAFSAGSSMVADIAVDSDGRVYTVDSEADTVRVWTIDPDATPRPPQTGGTACRLRGDKRAEPNSLKIGQTTEVSLSIGGECPNAAPRADIILAIDRSHSMNYDNKITTTIEAALTFVDAVDLAKDRIGIVTFSNSGRVDQQLTGSDAALESALRSITAIGGTDIADAIRVSVEELSSERHRDDALPVVILLTDGKDDDPDAVLSEAEAAKEQGVRLFTIGFGRVDPLTMVFSASTPEDYYYAPDPGELAGIYGEIARRLLATVLATEMTVVDVVPENMTFVIGSDSPDADWDPSPRTLTWHLTDVPFEGIQLTYELEPQDLGTHPTNVQASADYTDGLDQDGTLRFPVPQVEVLAKDPTPTPTFTPFPTVTPTPRPPKPIYLPIVLKQKCEDLHIYADVVLAMDTSGSMELPSTDGKETKIAAALRAATAFIERLNMPDDHAAIVTFDSESRLEQPLTADREALLAALDRIETATGTRIDLGLETAYDELTSDRARRRHNRVIVLLTDGKNSVSNDEVLDVAKKCTDERLLIFTIGLGTSDDVDFDLLRRVASDSDYFYEAPSTDDLDRIYEEIVFTLECVNLEWP